MKIKIHFPLLIALVLLAGCSKNNTDQPAVEATEKPDAHSAAITLDADAQKLSGLVVENLVALEWQPETKGFGRVVDVATFAAAVADFESARAAAQASAKELERLKTLAAQDNVSARALETAEAAARRDQTAGAAARAKFAQVWGGALADRADLETLVQQVGNGTTLVRIELPPGETLTAQPTAARIVPLADEEHPVTAEFFSAAAGIDPQTQQQSFVFAAKGGTLTPGAAVVGFLKVPGAATGGVVIPRNAVLRHDGRTWIYLQSGDKRFSRTEIPLDRATDGGWFSSELSATNRVVTVGAQQLLSEELKSQGGGE